jgi:tetratricopeptide (TPR) repeat protein/outer membrane biosynthesis protein TonB
MKNKLFIISLLFIFMCGLTETTSAQRKPARKPEGESASLVKNEKEELDAAIALAPAERIEKLKAFVAAHPRSALKMRALELIVSARAALGDEKLHAGDAAGGTEQFRLAVAETPQGMSEKLFTEVVAQIPTNLFLRGERATSIELARLIEEQVKQEPKRLLLIAAFYLGIEAADEALRVSDAVIKVAPEMSAAYQARAAAYRIALRLDESAADYARAVELDPKSESARRSLADLRRATGKTEEALALYRERLKIDAKDEFARTGLVVSLFELGKKEEAERELEAALKETPNSLALLIGAAYWFAAHQDSARAAEFARKAIAVEPRYTWGHVALARALLAQKRPLEAERTLLVARQYGRFPTLDYEMASALAEAGLYGEAAAILASSFAVKDEQIETYLAGRTLARSSSFTELLAPERRASIFQFTAADNEASARKLKSLLAFTNALNPSAGREAIREADVLAAAREFIGGEDEMRAFRRLYVASRLLEYNVALPKAFEMTEAVTSEVEAALNIPTAAVAVMAEELRSARASANMQGSTLNVPSIPRNTLANIMRGRIEDLAGWTLFNQSKPAEAIVRLKRATSVLPENSIWWTNAMWHLGASLDANGKQQEALEAYYKSYSSSGPDPTRRAVIESLYRRVNGSLEGLDARIGAAPVIAANTNPAESSVPTQSATDAGKTVETKPTDTLPQSDAANTSATTEQARPEPTPEPTPTPTPEPTPTPTPTPTPEQTPAPTPTPEQTPASEMATNTAPAEVPPGPPQPAVNDEPPATPTPTPQPTPSAPESARRQERKRRVTNDGKCTINVSEQTLTIQNNGGSALITVTLDGLDSTEQVTASTSDWSALAVFPEPKSNAPSSNALVFSVAPISKKTGLFTITFKSPCGSKDVTVTVK